MISTTINTVYEFFKSKLCSKQSDQLLYCGPRWFDSDPAHG